MLLIDDGDAQSLMCSTAEVKRQDRAVEQVSQHLDAGITTWRAAVDGRIVLIDCLCIRQTALIATLGALRLRQKRVDLLCQ